MRWLLKLLLMSGIVFAAVSEPDKQLSSPQRNILVNGGFENGAAGWTSTGGTLTTTNTFANVGYGNRAGGFLGSAAGQNLRSPSVAIPAGMYGRNGVASCLIQTPSGGATHLFQVVDGSFNVLASVPVTSTTNFSRSLVNFIYPSSGSVGIQVQTVASSEPQIYIDDCDLVPADAQNLSQVSQANFVGQVQWYVQGFFQFSPTGPTFSDAVGYTFATPPTVTGSVSAASAIGGINQFGINFSGGPGTYQATFNSADQSFGSGCTVTSSSEAYQVIDENNIVIAQGAIQQVSRSGFDQEQSWSLTATYVYTTSATHNWHLQAAGTCANTYFGNQGTNDGYSTVALTYFPSQQQLAFTPQTVAWFADAFNSSYTRAAAYGPGYYPGGSTQTTTPGSIATYIPCSGTNPPQSGSCTSGTAEDGISFFAPTAGYINVCENMNNQNAGTGNNVTYIRVDETANSDDSVVVQTGQQIYNTSYVSPSAYIAVGMTTSTCGIFYVSSPGQVTFRTNLYIPVTLSSGAFSPQIEHWTVTPMTQNIPAPILVNSVITPNVQRTKIQMYSFTCANSGSTITATNDTGAVANNGSDLGTCSISFGSAFTSNPYCIASGVYGGPTISICSTQNIAGPTGVPVTTYAADVPTAPFSQNGYCQMICVGTY
jgi:hypothetical protein